MAFLQTYTQKDNVVWEKWSEYITKHPAANVFQSPDMFDFLLGVPNYDPIVTISFKDKEMITGVLMGMIIRDGSGIKSALSSRCIVFEGPVIHTDIDSNEELVHELITDFTHAVKRKSIYIEFRNLTPKTDLLRFFSMSGYKYIDHLNIRIRIDDSTYSRIHNSKKRQIRKSLENGASIVEATNLSQVRDFYNILEDLYRKKVKKPLPPLVFFENFLENGPGRIFLVTYNDVIVGGIMCPVFQNKTIYEWYIAGNDKQTDGLYPSVLATWAPIDFALKNQIEYFDFMGAGSPHSDYGVRHFKAQFGGEELISGRLRRINRPILYFVGTIGLKFLHAF